MGEVTSGRGGGLTCDIISVETAEVGKYEEAMTTEIISKFRSCKLKRNKKMRDAKIRTHDWRDKNEEVK